MKNLTAIKNLLAMVVLGSVISGCTIEPIRDETKVVIKDAPDWVNKGSMILGGKDGRYFHGVSNAPLQGDMALQKSIANDRSMAEVGRVLLSYMDVVSNEYLNNSERGGSNRIHDDAVLRKIDESALRQINESVASQIDDAISRQFKETVSAQFKSEISRQVKEVATRKIRVAVSNQIDFLRELEEDISAQIKDSVAHQIKKTIKLNLAGARILDSWRDPKSNTIWSLSELDMTHVKSTIAGVNEMNVDLKSYVDANAEIIFDHIIRDRDSVNPFTRR